MNAVIYRLHEKKSFLRGRSFCPACRHVLKLLDLVPVFSFVFLKKRCRYCRRPISWQYPLVELAAAGAFALLYWQFGLSAEFFVYSLYVCFLIIIFVYDLRYYLILDKVSLTGAAVALILSFFALKISLMSLLWGALFGAGFFLLQFVVSRGKWIGGGDIRLGLLMGLMLGWPNILAALFIAYALGSVVGVGLILSGRKKWQSRVPFGTFLSLAAFLTFVFGEAIISFYKDLFAL